MLKEWMDSSDCAALPLQRVLGCTLETPDVFTECHEYGRLLAPATSGFRNHLTSTEFYFSTSIHCQQNVEKYFEKKI